MKLLQKKQKKINLQYDETQELSCDISIVEMDNFKDVSKVIPFLNARSITHMILEVKTNGDIRDWRTYMMLIRILPNDSYVADNGTLHIAGTINQVKTFYHRLLSSIQKAEYADYCLILIKIVEYLEKLFDEDGTYDELFTPTHYLSLDKLRKPTVDICEEIYSYTINGDKTIILAIDGKVLSFINDMIYYVYDDRAILYAYISDEQIYATLNSSDISRLLGSINEVDDDVFKQRFDLLLPIKQKIYNYFINYISQFAEKPTSEEDEESQEVDFSDIDEIVED